MIPPRIEPATFWLVEQCLNQLRQRVPPESTAVPGQPVKEMEQAPKTPSFSENKFNILVLQCWMYHVR